MKFTAREALDLGIWEEIAEICSYSVLAINEGMDDNIQMQRVCFI